MREILGVELEVNKLPADGGTGTVDMVGSALSMSCDQVDQYLALGRRALDNAFAPHAAATQPRKIHTEMK